MSPHFKARTIEPVEMLISQSAHNVASTLKKLSTSNMSIAKPVPMYMKVAATP